MIYDRFRTPVLGYRCNGLFWVRIFGWGIHIKDTKKHRISFSERIGITKSLRIGKWSIRLLKPFGV